MYSDAVDDDKLRMLAFEDRWHFVALCCLKSSGLLDADSPNIERRIAIKLGVQLTDLDEVKRRLMEAELIDADFQPTGWSKRQYEHDSSKERTRKYRERLKKKSSDGDVTSQERHATVTVTSTESDTDTDTDTEEQSTSSPNGDNPRGDPIPYQTIQNLWNEICVPAGLSECKVLNGGRKTAIRQRHTGPIIKRDLNTWADYFKAITRSQFLTGQIEGKRWRANLDWALKDASITKTFEGEYHR